MAIIIAIASDPLSGPLPLMSEDSYSLLLCKLLNDCKTFFRHGAESEKRGFRSDF